MIKSDSLFLIENLENGENIMTAVKVLALFLPWQTNVFLIPRNGVFSKS